MIRSVFILSLWFSLLSTHATAQVCKTHRDELTTMRSCFYPYREGETSLDTQCRALKGQLPEERLPESCKGETRVRPSSFQDDRYPPALPSWSDTIETGYWYAWNREGDDMVGFRAIIPDNPLFGYFDATAAIHYKDEGDAFGYSGGLSKRFDVNDVVNFMAFSEMVWEEGGNFYNRTGAGVALDIFRFKSPGKTRIPLEFTVIRDFGEDETYFQIGLRASFGR